MIFNATQAEMIRKAQSEILSALSLAQRTKLAEQITILKALFAEPASYPAGQKNKEAAIERRAREIFTVTNEDPECGKNINIVGWDNLSTALDLSPSSIRQFFAKNGGRSFRLKRMGFPEGLLVSRPGTFADTPETYSTNPLISIASMSMRPWKGKMKKSALTLTPPRT